MVRSAPPLTVETQAERLSYLEHLAADLDGACRVAALLSELHGETVAFYEIDQLVVMTERSNAGCRPLN